ncbi:matrilysin-like [Montipora capricornis]|uniref:matrilysin-like n=1 Tax=Montipora capricornis TaxID=246305 RepID=UPI0035F160F3
MWPLALFTVVFAVLQATEADLNENKFVLKYLNQFQYLSVSRSDSPSYEEGAIRRFQHFAGLKVTGRLNVATIRQMKMPRCGNPDGEEGSTRRRCYKTRSKWRKTHLTYYIQHGSDLTREAQNRIFAKALKYWADASALSFSLVNTASSADLKISFGRKRHYGTSAERECGSPFDGRGKVLAHAYFLSDGRAHFDEDETFTDGTSRGTNLLWVATHEFGHSLRLEHSSVRGAIMYPYYTGYKPNMKLHSDDIQGIRSLYGSGGGGGGGSGGCVDRDVRCKYWTGYCRSNQYVHKNCKKTCNIC